MYECTVDQELADAAAYAPGRCAGQTLRVHCPGGSTFLCEVGGVA